MADVRQNGIRLQSHSSVVRLEELCARLDAEAQSQQAALTGVWVNGKSYDPDSNDIFGVVLDAADIVEARVETTAQLSFESLQVAQEMAELLLFDLKVASLQLWEGHTWQERSLQTLLEDCRLFLTLGARPVELLGLPLDTLPPAATECLKQLDKVADNISDAVLLAVHDKKKEAVHVLIARVLPSLERWLGLTGVFAEALQVDTPAPPSRFIERTEHNPVGPVSRNPTTTPVKISRLGVLRGK